MVKITAWVAVCVLFLSGCQAAIQTPAPDLKTPLVGTYDPNQLTPTPAPPDGGQDISVFPPGVVAAQVALAESLDLPLEVVSVVRVEANQWTDSCLGLGTPEEICAQQIVDGFYVVLQAEEKFFEYRTDSLGTVVRPLILIGELPAAADAARRALAALLQANDPLEIAVVDVEPVEWPNACLGVEQAGIMCADVITPGYRVVLSAQGIRYEYHTDAQGTQVLASGNQAGQFGQVYVMLRSISNQQPCRLDQIAASGVSTGPCAGELQAVPFPDPQRPMELSHLVARFASFSAETPSGVLIFNGRGQGLASENEQRAIAAWAKIAVQDALGMLPGLQQGLLLTWRRSGGIAGLCDELRIYETGWAYAGVCPDGDFNSYGKVFLDVEQLEIVYNWQNRLAPLQVTRRDNFADGFQYDLTFIGHGELQANPSQEQEMYALADALFAAAIP